MTVREKELEQANRELQQELERIMQVHDCHANKEAFKTTGKGAAWVERCKICGETLWEELL